MKAFMPVYCCITGMAMHHSSCGRCRLRLNSTMLALLASALLTARFISVSSTSTFLVPLTFCSTCATESVSVAGVCFQSSFARKHANQDAAHSTDLDAESDGLPLGTAHWTS